MSNEELGNYDPEMMRDPAYRKMVEEAKALMSNARQVIRSNENKPQTQAPTPTPEQTPTTKEGQVVLSEPQKLNQPIDFNLSDFQNMMRLDNNSTISKMQNIPTGGNKPIGSIWMGKDEMKKYFACKNIFKVKIVNQVRYNTYRFHSINSEQQQILFRMVEDIRNFYPLMVTEGAEIDEGRDKPTKVLVRDGKNYRHISEIMVDYRKEIAFMCLGIEYEDFERLEMFSDPNYTILDIWGINDILDGILERALSGTSYFLIPSDKL